MTTLKYSCNSALVSVLEFPTEVEALAAAKTLTVRGDFEGWAYDALSNTWSRTQDGTLCEIQITETS